MDSGTRETWERFYDRVVIGGRDWPRNLWFAAVEDGLSAALPAQSALLAQYRQNVAELEELERSGAGAYRDTTRMAQLEADIKRLIGVADQSIREESAERLAALRPPRTGFWLGALTLGVIMFCGVLLGVTYHLQQRAAERMDLELAAMQQRLIKQAADQRSALEMRIRSVDRVKEDLGALQTELRANVDEFNKVMSTSLNSLSALGDSAIADLERQLLDQDGGAGDALNSLRERAAALEGQLDQVDASLGTIAQRLPDLDSDMKRLAERLEATMTRFEGVESQVSTIQAQAPEVALWLEGQRQALAQELDARRQTINELGTQMTALQDGLEGSRSQLVDFDGTLEQDLARAKQQSEDLEGALDQVRAAEQQATELVTQVDARFGTTQQTAQKQIDALLAKLTEQTDLALQRSEEMMQRAEAEAARRLETATEQAIGSLSEVREAQLAELRAWASQAQTELGQTRADLVADWQGMDEAVAGRQSQVLAQLDQHAAALEVRVQEFLKALDGIAARSSG